MAAPNDAEPAARIMHGLRPPWKEATMERRTGNARVKLPMAAYVGKPVFRA